MNITKTSVMAAVAVIGFAAMLSAEESARPARTNPCEKDIASLCSSAKTEGMDSVKTCLEKNKESLSDTCRQFVSRMGKKGNRNACNADIKKFCSEVKKGDFKALKSCLETNKAELTKACATELANMKEPPQRTSKSGEENARGERPDGPPPDGERPDGPPPGDMQEPS